MRSILGESPQKPRDDLWPSALGDRASQQAVMADPGDPELWRREGASFHLGEADMVDECVYLRW